MTTASKILGKSAPPAGLAPSIVLTNPRFPHNVGMTVRLASLNLATAVATILWHRAEQLGELPDQSGTDGIGWQDTDPDEIGVFGENSWPPS